MTIDAPSLGPEQFRLLMRRLQSQSSVDMAHRLARYLATARPLLRESAQKGRVGLGQSAISVSRLDRLIEDLRPLLKRSLAAGGYANVWAVAGLKRDEVRNTAVLTWFLDPLGTHGLGGAMLEAFLDRVAHVHPAWSMPRFDLASCRVRTEFRPHGSATDRVDIAVEDARNVMFVEVKIDANEGNLQLERYVAAAAAIGKPWCLIYLAPSPPQQMPRGAVWIVWRDVRVAAEKVALRTPEGLPRSILQQFGAHITAF